MDLVHDRGSMDLVQESGPWTRSKEGVHGPLVHVLSSPGRKSDLRALAGNFIRLYLTSSIQILPSGSLDKLQ